MSTGILNFRDYCKNLFYKNYFLIIFIKLQTFAVVTHFSHYLSKDVDLKRGLTNFRIFDQIILNQSFSTALIVDQSWAIYCLYRFQLNCVKIIQMWSFFWSAFSRIWTKYRYLQNKSFRILKIQTRENSVFGHFSHSGSE